MPPSAQLSSALVQAARGMRVYVCMYMCVYVHTCRIHMSNVPRCSGLPGAELC